MMLMWNESRKILLAFYPFLIDYGTKVKIHSMRICFIFCLFWCLYVLSVSECVFCSSSSFLPQSKHMQARWKKLWIACGCECKCECVCLPVCVGPCNRQATCPAVYPASHQMDAGIGSDPPWIKSVGTYQGGCENLKYLTCWSALWRSHTDKFIVFAILLQTNLFYHKSPSWKTKDVNISITFFFPNINFHTSSNFLTKNINSVTKTALLQNEKLGENS